MSAPAIARCTGKKGEDTRRWTVVIIPPPFLPFCPDLLEDFNEEEKCRVFGWLWLLVITKDPMMTGTRAEEGWALGPKIPYRSDRTGEYGWGRFV